MTLSNNEIAQILEREPRFRDVQLSLQFAPKMPRAFVKETQQVIALARRFCEEVVRPVMLESDLKGQMDHDYVPEELVKKANEWGFYTMWIPRAFGGQGYNMNTFAYFNEEIAASCAGIAQLVGVHYLGITACSVAGNVKFLKRLCGYVVEGERTGKPCFFCAAVTEPAAGTDVEEMELVKKGKTVRMTAKKVDGGWILNGQKVFISGAAMSSYAMIGCYEDINDPSVTSCSFLVKRGTPGFTVGRAEVKMGQKSCPVNELILEDVFVSDDDCLVNREQQSVFKRDVEDINQQKMDYALCVTRPAVGAFGTGIARGAFEKALQYAAHHEMDGELLINQEWVQSKLAEMYRNISIGRLAYVEANYANSLYGFYKALHNKAAYYYLKYVPQGVLDAMMPYYDKPFMTKLYRKSIFEKPKQEDSDCCAGWASLAKFNGTDAGMRNCHIALEIMGQDGLRHDQGCEKILRDAKLLQIYEGTNQLNRLHLFNTLVRRNYPQAKSFNK